MNEREDNTTLRSSASACDATPEDATASPQELAMMEFEPWQGVPTGEFIHTATEWADLGELHLPTARMAYVLMFKSKAQLVGIVKNAPEEFMVLVDQIGEMRDSLGGYVGLLDNAEARLMVALSAVSVEPSDDTPNPEAP